MSPPPVLITLMGCCVPVEVVLIWLMAVTGVVSVGMLCPAVAAAVICGRMGVTGESGLLPRRVTI